jgi:transposase-like protein
MKSTLRLSCPNGCRTVEANFKLVRHYGPNRTPLYRCLDCGREFSARHSSVFSGFHTEEQTIYRVLKALAEGNGIRACARIFDLDKNTVVRILETAALHCQGVSEHLIQSYHLEECQVDELWSFVKKRKHVSRHLRNWPRAMATSGFGLASTHATKS